MHKGFAIAAVIVATAIVGTTAYFAFSDASGDAYADCRTSRIAGGSTALGGPFTLIGADGQAVASDTILTSPSLIYFGYSYCPDVCPLDSARTAETVEILKGRGISVPHVFITIDPERDTPELVGEFTSYFDDDMIGLTGSAEEIAKVAKSYRVYFAKNGEGEDYLMDHSTMTYLTEADGRVIEFFRRDLDAETLANTIQCFANAS